MPHWHPARHPAAIDVEDYDSDVSVIELRHRPESEFPPKIGAAGERSINVSKHYCEVLATTSSTTDTRSKTTTVAVH